MDSSSPVIFKRNKAKPTSRARDTSPENSTNDVSETAEDSPSTVALKLKNKIKRTKAKSRLSFGGDEEEEGDGDVFKMKKSSLSRKMALGTHPAIIPPTLDQATISTNESPRYDAAYLKELKASTPTSRPSLPSNIDPYDADMSIDIDDVSMQSMVVDTEDNASFIPSESSIQVAKQKRERLRKTQASGEEDFISLSVAKRDDVPQGPHPESRLMREEDELGEGDDEFAEYTSAQERIALGKKSRKLEASQRRDAMKEMIADADEEDEETVEWEQEQVRRGGHRTPEPSSSKVKQVYKPATIPVSTPIPSLGPAISHLSHRLSQLTASHAKNSAALSSFAQERLEVDEREKEMREMVEKAEEKRAWFTDFKEWTESVASFLDEKYPLLESLEDERVSLLKERFEMVANRRREDFEDDLTEFLGPLPDAPMNDPEDMDEHGRTMPKPNRLDGQRQRRVARTARRQIRRSRHPHIQEEEGYSTDSSLSPQDTSAYSEALQSLSSRGKAVLSDVKAAEFKDPGKGRWSVWRDRYVDSYVGAWGGLGVVSVWEFWVRLESLTWNFIEDRRSLDSFKWYKGLFEYCRPGEGNIEERALGPDGDLVASMISSAVIPHICRVIDNGGLDVYSSNDTKRIIDLAEEIEASLENKEGKFQLLLRSVFTSFESAVSAIRTSIDAYTRAHQTLPGFNPDSISSRRRSLNHCTKLLKNLLRWRKYAGNRSGVDMLVSQLVEDCIVIIARTGWEVGGEECVRTVVKLLPDGLAPSSLSRLRGTR